MRGLFALALLLAPSVGFAGSIRGEVVDATDGEPLAQIEIRVEPSGEQTVTSAAGEFVFEELPPGAYRLRFLGVGYRPLESDVELSAAEEQSVSVQLLPESLTTSESVDVSAGPYGQELPAAVSLSGSELRNLASVLTDDPLRAVQGLPGVTASDDFQSQFALRGAGFRRVGLYVDGILLRSPFHTVHGDPNNPSVTVLNGDTLDSVNLLAGAPPVSYYDRTAGAIDVRTREGDREQVRGRATASMSSLAGTFEGPIGSGERGSWLVSARKSYLQYLLRAVSDDDELAFGFTDVQARANYDLAPGHTASLSFVDGTSGLDRLDSRDDAGPNADIESKLRFTMARAAVRHTFGSRVVAENRVAYLRERFENLNRSLLPLAEDFYAEWSAGGNASWSASEASTFDAGWTLRRRREDGYFVRRSGPDDVARVNDQFRGTGVLSGAYGQHSLLALDGRVQTRAGVRLDHGSANSVTSASPFASMSLYPWRSTQVQAEWGQAVQHPELSLVHSQFGARALLPERANHFRALVEQTLPSRTRLRAEVFHRWDRDLVARPLVEPRILDGTFIRSVFDTPFTNALRAYTRGFQIFAQRRSANGITGWASYSWSRSTTRDGLRGIEYPSDFDQRHTVQVFGSYRATARLNVSGKFSHGSGLPLPGFFRRTGPESLQLATLRNQVRLPYFQRLDLRVNKLYAFKSFQLTIFGEVINVLNRENVRSNFQGGFNPIIGNLVPDFESTFPTLPSVGMVIEF